MATISLTIPDAQLQRVLDGVCGLYGYQAGTETKAQFAKRIMGHWLKDAVSQWESTQASETARTSALADVAANVSVS